MSTSLKKLWNDYGIGGVLLAIIVLYVVFMLYKYFNLKGMSGSEYMGQNTNPAYVGGSSTSGAAPMPAQEGDNEVYSDVNAVSSQNGVSKKNQEQNPADLLPKDTNSQWAQLNPTGQGDLANINLLKAGYHIGIDTIGQSLRNANLQIRSEPPNPQVNTGIWNQSTITPDFMRPPLEIGQGSV
jgi:hypothetical protein